MAAVTVAGLAALGVVVYGQQAGRDDRNITTGSVDFVVVSRDGTPVTDLKVEELTLRIGGQPRPIRSLQYIKLGGEITTNRAAATAAAVEAATKPAANTPPPYFTNTAAASDIPRVIIIVVDDESMPIGQEHKLRTALTNFVRDLPASDRVGIVTVPHGGVKSPPTTDRVRLAQVISEISPISPIEPEICRTRSTLQVLENTLNLLTRGVEQPVTVAILSAALTGPSRQEAAQKPSALTGGGGVSAQAGGCYLRTDDFVDVGNAAAGTRAQVYVIHPDYNPNPVQEGIENLRSQTGAPLFHLDSSAEPGLYRMARETSGYYVATFDTEPTERAGKPVPSQVRTTRQNVEVRVRPYVTVGRAAIPATSGATTVATSAFEMVRSGKAYRDFQLRATTATTKNADGTVNVLVMFEPAAGGAIMTASAALFDEKDRAIAVWPAPDKMEMEKAVLSGPGPYTIGLIVMPGEYRLRIGVIDSTGRQGLIDDRISATLESAGTLKLGGLLLGQNSASGFVPKMLFAKESSAMAFLEVYGGTEGAGVGAVVEIANTANGPAIHRERGVFGATAEDGRYTVSAMLPIGALKPGDYVVRAIVGATDQPQGRVIRTLRKLQ